jgi:hypothetical protein
MDAAIVAAIRRGDELLQQVYSSSAAPACSPPEEQGYGRPLFLFGGFVVGSSLFRDPSTSSNESVELLWPH